MRTRTSRARLGARRIGLDSMAGWLFADLLLVLFVVALGMELTVTPEPEPKPSPTVEATPTPEAEPEPEGPPGMQLDPVEYTIPVDGDALLGLAGVERKAAELERLSSDLQRQTEQLAGQRAAMVIIWGVADSVGRGNSLAREFNPLLRTTRPEVFDDFAVKELWDGRDDGEPEAVTLEIYLFDESQGGIQDG